MRVSGGPFVLTLVLLATALASLPSAPAEPGADDATVQVGNFYFEPATVTIAPGETVDWQWVSGTHSIETRDGSEEWCGVRSSGSCSKVFSQVGTFAYRCGVHPGSMLGTVIVEGATPQVQILNPADGADVDGPFTANGEASHPDGITAVAWRIDDGAYQPVDTIDGSGDVTWSTLVPVDGLAAGDHTLTVRATETGGGTATDTVDFRLLVPDAVDLRVTHLTVQNGLQSVQLRATADNTGGLPAAGAELRFEYHYHGTWREIATYALDLDAGGSATRSHTWEPYGKIGAFDVRAVIDPEDAFVEADETNNQKEGRASFGSALVPGFDPREPL